MTFLPQFGTICHQGSSYPKLHASEAVGEVACRQIGRPAGAVQIFSSGEPADNKTPPPVSEGRRA